MPDTVRTLSTLLALAADNTAGAITPQTLRDYMVSADALYDHAAGTIAWSRLSGVPFTIGGYGITDFNSLGDARWVQLGNFNSLGDARYAAITHTHAASAIVSGVLAMARLATGTPDGTKFIRDDGVLAVPAGAVSSVYGRTGAVVKAAGDYSVADISGAAPLASPNFTGTPLAPTPTTGDATTKIATTSFVATAVSGANISAYDNGVHVYDVKHPSYGAAGNGSIDDTTAIQAAITAAAATGGTVRFSRGTYKITATLQGKVGVNLLGEGGASGSPSDFSRLLWGGAGGGTMLNFGNPDNVGQNLQDTSIRNLTFYGAASGTVNASRPTHAITFSKNADTTTNKLDFFSVIERCSFQRFGGDAIQYNGGATNLHIRDCRWDHISGYAVYVDCKTGTWLGSISNVTWDTGGETETTPNGFVMLDGQATLADTTGHSRFQIQNARLEVNKALTGNLGVIALGVSGTSTTVVQHYLKCDTVSFDFASSTIAGANYVVAIVGGPSDGVDIDMTNVNTQFPDSVLGYCNGLTSTWCAPNPTSSNKYHPTRWTCRPFMYGSPGSSQSRSIFGEKTEFRTSICIGGDGTVDANARNKRGFLDIAPCSALPDTPPTGYLRLFNNNGVLSMKDSTGATHTVNLT